MEENIVFIKKSEEVYTTNKVLDVFNSTDDLNLIGSYVEKAQERLYASWASADAKDSAGERIPIEDIIKDQEILINKRHGPISDSHTNAIVGETLAYKILIHPETKTKGVLHLNKIHDDNIVDDKVWKETQSGKRTGSSVGGFSNPNGSKFTTFDGDIVKELSGFRQFETASVEEPCNPFATNVAVSQVAKGDNIKMSEDKSNEIINAVQKEANIESTEKVDVVEDSNAFVNKEEMEAMLGPLVEKVNALADVVGGLTSGGEQVESEAVETQEEETEKMDDETEETEKETVGEGEVDKIGKMIEAAVSKAFDKLNSVKKEKTVVAKVVKSAAGTRVEDTVTNAASVNKKQDMINKAISGNGNWDDILYGDL